MLVKATREGLLGKREAAGYIIDTRMPFVALPSSKALYSTVRVTNPKNGKSIIALVLDVGPWNAHDENYVFGNSRPQAESGTDLLGRTTNGAGIDLGEKVWAALGMEGNDEVDWEFIT